MLLFQLLEIKLLVIKLAVKFKFNLNFAGLFIRKVKIG
jgi:hypothetical protein